VVTSTASAAKAGKYGDLQRRLVFLLLALVVYRAGAHIPVPGIDPVQLQQFFKGQQGGILGMFNICRLEILFRIVPILNELSSPITETKGLSF